MAKNYGVSSYIFPEEEVYISPNGFSVAPSRQFDKKKIYAGESATGLLNRIVGSKIVVSDEYFSGNEEIDKNKSISSSEYKYLKNLTERAMSGDVEAVDEVKSLLGNM